MAQEMPDRVPDVRGPAAWWALVSAEESERVPALALAGWWVRFPVVLGGLEPESVVP